MANLRISDLYSLGSELFWDSESFLNDLDDREEICTIGGIQQYNFQVSANMNGVGGNGLIPNLQVGVFLNSGGNLTASIALNSQGLQAQTFNYAQSFING
jgi:hypothetical protein